MEMTDWYTTLALAAFTSSTLLIPRYRWMAVVANLICYSGLIAGYLVWKNTGQPLSMGWSTLIYMSVMSAISIHVYLWFMSSITQARSNY